MIPISHVKLYHGQIIDIRDKPNPEAHYEIIDNILWIVPDHQRSTSEFLHMISEGTIIARGVNEKEVDITMPLDFHYYHMWCIANGFKPHEADTLSVYVKRYDSRGDIRVVQT